MTDNLYKKIEYEKMLNLVKDYISEGYNNNSYTDLYSESDYSSFLSDNGNRLNRFVTPNELKDFNDYIHNNAGKSFKEMLFGLIEKQNLTYLECYSKALVSKGTASKIKNDIDYKPSKNTVISFAIALKLNLDETQALLGTVSMCLSDSVEFDRAIKAFITYRYYDIFDINNILYDLGLDTLIKINSK